MKKTFHYQDSLPKIPIPELNETCDKFIEWVQPLLNEKEFANTKKIVEKFKAKGADGEKLQNELIKWSERKNLLNWTAPFWEDIYLKARTPLVKNGNVFYLIKNRLKTLGLPQANIAASLVISVLKFKSLIDSEELEVDLQNGQPICMEQYKRLFSSTRIPRREKDDLKITKNQKHIIVLHKGNMFSIDVYKDSEEIKSFLEIKKDLEYIIASSKTSKNNEIGIFTAMNRDKWADTRDKLLKISNRNNKALKKVEDAIFVLCLEDESPESLEDASRMMLHGNGKNRWFDKSLQFIVLGNGEIGVNIEHAGMDGSVMSRFIKFISEDIDKVYKKEDIASENKPEKLVFHINNELKEIIKNSYKEFNDIASDTKTRVLNFDKFGKDLIKTFKVSPDAFVQLALQLAQYKLYGRCYSTYEAVMTRKFIHGRIEVMYCVSLESMQFIKNMVSANGDDKITAKYLVKAAEKHIDRINECKNGKGVDGHLFALLNMYEYFGADIGVDALPEIFTDKGYRILTHSTVCTSTSSPKGLKLAGYGPVVDDGFGVRYIKEKEFLTFNITSRNHMEDKLEMFVSYIEESLIEMAKLMKSIY